jgi:Protein of unknown function (DUF3892)
MASYRIVCVEKDDHITAVGTGTNPRKASKRWTVAKVRERLDAGDRFYTEDGDGNQADVEPYGEQWIRTDPDAQTDNNLDNLRACRSFGST